MKIQPNNARYILLLIVAIGFALRFAGIDQKGIWLDEKTSISNATGVNYQTLIDLRDEEGNIIFTSKNIWANNQAKNVFSNAIKKSGGNAIVYNLALYYWIKFFGTSDTAVRFLSLLFGIGIIIIGYSLTFKVSTRNFKIALLAGFLLAVNFFLIRYSQEARSYSMATFFCLAVTYIFYKIVEKDAEGKKLNWLFPLYGIAAILSIFSHFLTFGFFLGHFFYLIVFVKDKKVWNRLYVLIGAGLLALVVFLIKGGYEGIKIILERSQNYGEMAVAKEITDGFGLPVSFHSVTAGLLQVFFQVFGNGFQNFGVQIRYIAPLAVIPVFLIWQSYLYFKSSGKQPIFFFLALPIIFQFGLGLILSLVAGHNIPFQVLYYLFITPLALILMGFGIYYVLSGIKTVVSGSFLIKITIVSLWFLIMVFSLISKYFSARNSVIDREGNPYVSIANSISAQILPGDTIYFGQIPDAVVTNFYLKKDLKNKQKIAFEKHQKIYLLNRDRKVEIFDFEGKEIRY